MAILVVHGDDTQCLRRKKEFAANGGTYNRFVWPVADQSLCQYHICFTGLWLHVLVNLLQNAETINYSIFSFRSTIYSYIMRGLFFFLGTKCQVLPHQPEARQAIVQNV
jgi:hypothetical protein